MKVVCSIKNVDTLNGHQAFLCTEYEVLLERAKFSEVTFIIGKQELRLHKSILSSRSPVFAAMFDNNFEESVSNKVVIEDQSFEVMKEFFRYIYAAKINNIEDHAIELLGLSNKYVVVKLINLCEEYLMSNIKKENALDYLNIASLYTAENLISKCIAFIISNVKEIAKVPGFDINVLPRDVRNDLFKLLAEKS
ncbi:hypothetical protein QAD02_016600 [Eretmocerus hayati]|uniref:Uncharacterized protein n=1 Tax=Eretmocerus hayati TaxID=131215 RepID=A0ACC2PBI2_9HYME|nr:hypothetical protein QAD02_016600 [Eretmocerus hayati]